MGQYCMKLRSLRPLGVEGDIPHRKIILPCGMVRFGGRAVLGIRNAILLPVPQCGAGTHFAHFVCYAEPDAGLFFFHLGSLKTSRICGQTSSCST